MAGTPAPGLRRRHGRMAAEPPVLPGAEEARRWAAEELSQPEYRDAAPPWVETLWQDFLEWLSSLDGSPDPSSTVPSPVIGLVIAVIIMAAVIIARPRLNHKARRVIEVFDTEGVLAAADYGGALKVPQPMEGGQTPSWTVSGPWSALPKTAPSWIPSRGGRPMK